MKKWMALISVMLFVLLSGATAAMAENGSLADYDESEAGPPQQIISCADEGFSAQCPAWCEVRYMENGGVTIDIPNEDLTLWVRISRMETEADFDPEDYFLENITPEILGYLGNRSIEVGKFVPYDVGDREMYGKEYTFTISDRETKWLCVLDQEDANVVQYDAYFAVEKTETVKSVLDKIARTYRSDPEYYFTQYTDRSKFPKKLAEISCPELGFSTKADPDYPWDYQEGTGISIYTETEGSIPYVIIYRSEDLILEPREFIREQITPGVRQKYGDDLLNVVEYEAYVIGGKELAAAEYTYLVGGNVVKMLRLLDSSGSSTVSYTAKYLEDQAKETAEALETAIKNFQPMQGK